MFTSLRLGNFKRFQHCQLDLRKINIIVGPNNSGKSSLIASLRLIVQTLDSYDEQVQLLLNGPLGDFGTFKDIVYKNHRGRPIEIGFNVQIPDIDGMLSSTDETGTSDASFDLIFKYDKEGREIYAETIRISIDEQHIISLKYSKETRRHNVEKIGKTNVPSALKPQFSREFRVRHFLPSTIFGRLGVTATELEDGSSAYRQFIDSLSANGDVKVIRILNRLGTRLTRVIGTTDYLGPLRTPPARTYLFSGEKSKRIGVGGENMTAILATTNNSRRPKGRDPRNNLNAKLNAWLKKSRMANAAILAPISDRHFEIRIRNFFTGEDQNIADVGYGHSQVLPFLTGGYALSPNSVYMAEQPELHLHPRAQADLSDFILELHQKNTQTVIETHSEHIILRLQQHVAAGDINPDDIQIFYVHNDLSAAGDNGANPGEICVIKLNKHGQFLQDWPNGFFPEKLDEAKKLARIRFSDAGFLG